MVIKNVNLETVCGITSKLPKNTLPEVAFAGKSNVGKSSLINALVNRKSLARTSGQPGKTQTINFYNVNEEMYIVDLPGYGYAKVSKEVAAKWGPMIENYLHTSEQLRMVFLLIDLRHKPTNNDVQMYRWILSNGFSPVIVATKADKIKRSQLQKQLKQLKDTEKRDKFKVYGELLNTYGYQVTEGAKSVEVPNYYTGEMLTIPLDETLSPLDNAKKYFARYNKLKRTFEALNTQTEETKTEIAHLQTIQAALAIAESEDDLAQIRDELETYGYIRRKMNGKKKQKFKSKPFHYRSSDGFDIYVGKNNFQNDELTFKVANGNDWWFHAKGMPGSHVIVKTEGRELPDRTFEEAGRLAGYYSSGRDNEKIEIDYLQRKNVKKPNGAVAGYVIYYTNYSLTIHPDISGIEKISE